jgi:hypothetical protein
MFYLNCFCSPECVAWEIRESLPYCKRGRMLLSYHSPERLEWAEAIIAESTQPAQTYARLKRNGEI